jgi:hypothetical protein
VPGFATVVTNGRTCNTIIIMMIHMKLSRI